MSVRHHAFLLPTLALALVLSGCGGPSLGQRLGLTKPDPEQQAAEQIRLNHETGVVVVRRYSVTPGTEADFVNRWQKVAEYLKDQPGYLTTTMHRNPDDFKAWDNKSQWESHSQYEAAISSERYKELTAFLPEPQEEKAYLVRRHGDGNEVVTPGK